MSDNAYNIFYTDDDADDREVFKEVIEELNEDVYIFTQRDGDELMDMLKNPPPRAHLIFLDLNMPGKNGYEVLKEIRASEKFRDLPVIIFSTSNDSESISQTRALGATLYINKPTSYAEMKRILKRILSFEWERLTPAGMDFVYAG